MTGLKIIATGGALPSRVVTNDDLSKIVDTSDEWIYPRTGIHSRYFCGENESATDLAIKAASQALERSGIDRSQVGCVIVATLSAEFACPGTACLIQEALDLPNDLAALDVNAACTGFIYGTEVARGFLSSNGKKYALVVGVENLSKILDMTDRTTCVLFGDGAGAAVYEADDDTMYHSIQGACGSKDILVPGVNEAEGKSYVSMNGKNVFKFAVSAIPRVINGIFDKAKMTMEDVDWVICHQANSRIIDHVVKKYKAPTEKFYKNMDHFGNTSAASVPLALNELCESGKVKSGDSVMLVGFGGGLTEAGVLLRYEPAKND